MVSICRNTDIELDLGPAESTHENGSGRNDTAELTLEEYSLELQISGTHTEWREVDLLQGFYNDADDTEGEEKDPDLDTLTCTPGTLIK